MTAINFLVPGKLNNSWLRVFIAYFSMDKYMQCSSVSIWRSYFISSVAGRIVLNKHSRIFTTVVIY